MKILWMTPLVLGFGLALGCAGDDQPTCESDKCDGPPIPPAIAALNSELKEAIVAAAKATRHKDIPLGKEVTGLGYFKLPHLVDVNKDGDFDNTEIQAWLDKIPQDRLNKLTVDKVALGKLLFHDSGMANNPVRGEARNQFSCAACHNAEAAFKAGIRHGIGEGGVGYGHKGRDRVAREFYDSPPNCVPRPRFGESTDETNCMDIQTRMSPTMVNMSWQFMKLWDGSLGASAENRALPKELQEINHIPRAPLHGIETEAIAAPIIHRQDSPEIGVTATNSTYKAMIEEAFKDDGLIARFVDLVLKVAFKGHGDLNLGGLRRNSLAMAAYTRTLLTTEAPFQKWLRADGNSAVMTEQMLRGAKLFFGKAKCVSCHTGPALNHPEFFAMGFGDLGDIRSKAEAVAMGGRIPSDIPDTAFLVQGDVPTSITRTDDMGNEIAPNPDLGRGGFTQNPAENFRFKVPTLYNLTDAAMMGHGATFFSVRDVVEYMNQGTSAAQNKLVPADQLNLEPSGLGLTSQEIDDLVVFLEQGLHDNNLLRYQPEKVESDLCIIVADEKSRTEDEDRCKDTVQPSLEVR